MGVGFVVFLWNYTPRAASLEEDGVWKCDLPDYEAILNERYHPGSRGTDDPSRAEFGHAEILAAARNWSYQPLNARPIINPPGVRKMLAEAKCRMGPWLAARSGVG